MKKNELITRQKAFYFLNSYLNILPDPDEILIERGQDISIYRKLTFDAHVESCMTSRESGFLGREWQIIPATNSRADKKASDFAVELFSGLDMSRILREIQESVYYGYSVLEKIFIRDGSQIVYQDIVGKPAEWFRFDNENRLVFLTRENPSTGEPVDMEKIELCRFRASYRNPYGERKLARIFWPVMFKKGGFQFWVEFAEKFGGAMLLGKVAPGTSKEKKDILLSMLDHMVNSAVAVIENGEAVEAINTGKEGSGVFERLVSVCNAEISKAFLGQTLTTENNAGAGSYAMSKTHQEVRWDIADTDKKLIAGAMNRLISSICAMNFNANAPVFKFFEEEDMQSERADRDSKLSGLGVSFSKQYFIDNYNLKESDFAEAPAESFAEPGKKKMKFLI